MLREFKKFALRGSVFDMAIGIIIGSAFNKIVNSLVNDVLMPVAGLFVGRINFDNLFVALDGNTYATLAEAHAAGVATINYGLFINAVIDFAIMAFVMFVMVQKLNRLRQRSEVPAPVPAPTTKSCPYCLSKVPLKAQRCAHCTSELSEIKCQNKEQSQPRVKETGCASERLHEAIFY